MEKRKTPDPIYGMHWVQLKLDSHDEMSLMLVPSNARIARSTNIRVRRIRCQIIDGGPSFLHSGIIGLLAQMTLTVCNNNNNNKNQSNDKYHNNNNHHDNNNTKYVESDVRSLMAALHSSTVHISVIELATLIAGQ